MTKVSIFTFTKSSLSQPKSISIITFSFICISKVTKLHCFSKMGSHGSCPLIKNILLLDSEGKRVAVKYFSDDWPTNSSKLAFEKFVFSKTLKTNARTEAEITLLGDNIIIYKFVQDLHFFVTGSDDDNEIVLASVLQGLFDAITLLLRNNVDKREALENLDLILLCLDEIVDGEMILETNGPLIAEKVTSHNIDADSPLSEQVVGTLSLNLTVPTAYETPYLIVEDPDTNSSMGFSERTFDKNPFKMTFEV